MKYTLAPGRAGLIGAYLAIQFFLTVLLLGLFQPGYDHLTDTISMLVLGKYGFIQTINFIVISLSFLCIGYGLGKNIYNKTNNRILHIFAFFAAGGVTLSLIPTDRVYSTSVFNYHLLSSVGKAHYLIVLGLLFITPILFLSLAKEFKKSEQWKSLIPITISMLIFNFIVGIAWFYMSDTNYFFVFKGLVQKVMAMNVLLWLVLVGTRLWLLDRHRLSSKWNRNTCTRMQACENNQR